MIRRTLAPFFLNGCCHRLTLNRSPFPALGLTATIAHAEATYRDLRAAGRLLRITDLRKSTALVVRVKVGMHEAFGADVTIYDRYHGSGGN